MTRSNPFAASAILLVLTCSASATTDRVDPLPPPPISASLPWMEDAAIRSAFSGKTLQGHYANGVAFTESYGTGGAVNYLERERSLPGHWSVQGGAFCTIYHRDAAGGCYRVKQITDNCYEFYYVARTEFEAANGLTVGPAWTARAAVSDRTSTCDDRPSV